jgi:hypothetical protein
MACGGSPRPDGKLARNRCRCTPRQNSRHALWHCGGGATGNKGRDTMKSILTGVPMARSQWRGRSSIRIAQTLYCWAALFRIDKSQRVDLAQAFDQGVCVGAAPILGGPHRCALRDSTKQVRCAGRCALHRGADCRAGLHGRSHPYAWSSLHHSSIALRPASVMR